MKFAKSQFCYGVLIMYFDDIITKMDGAVLFDDDMADRIIDFIEEKKVEVNTLLAHYYAGKSRSREVSAFAIKFSAVTIASTLKMMFRISTSMMCWRVLGLENS